MYLTFMEFIKSESGICLLLAIGCVIFAILLIFLIIRDRKEKQESYTKLNIKDDIKAKEEIAKVKTEEKVIETKKPVAEEKKEVKKVKVEKTVEDKIEEKVEEPAETKKVSRVTNYHVSKHPDGGWQVKRAGAERALKKFKTQAEAIAFAKEKSENQDNNVVIHKKSGQIRKQDYSKK